MLILVLWLLLGLPFGLDRWLDVSEPPAEADAIICIGGGTTESNLPIEEGWRPAVKANLQVSLRLARLVDEFPLPDETEPASVFSA